MNLKQNAFPAATVPLALFGIVVLTYGPLIPWLGFYWDDWPYLWSYQSYGPAGFLDFVARDRPFSAWIFTLTTALFGENPLFYHLLALILRWLTAVLVWWILRMVWPQNVHQATWVAFLFAVYPGFKSQPIALIYNHHLAVLALFLLSLGTMLLAVRKPAWYWPLTIISLASSLSMFSLEYYVGLELLRPPLLWLALRERIPDHRQRFYDVVRKWAPFLAVLALYLVWRVALFEFPTYQPALIDHIQETPLEGSLALAVTIYDDILDTVVRAWFSGLKLTGNSRLTAPTLLLILAGAVLTFYYLFRLRGDETQSENDSQKWVRSRWAMEAMLLGGFAILIAGWPAWVTTLPVHLTFPYDRMTLPFMLGASLVAAGFIQVFIRPRLPQLITLAAITGIAAGIHFKNAALFRSDLEAMRSFFWQLAWRAPRLEPGTTVLTHHEPFIFYSDNSLTSPLNFIYAPGVSSPDLGYVFYNVEVRLGRGLPDLEMGLPVIQDYRSFSFTGSTSDMLVVYAAPPGCLRVIDPAYESQLPGMSELLLRAAPLSEPGQIIINAGPPAKPQANLFGAEPDHGWCYYFEKAELARQAGDWPRVTELGDIALNLPDGPEDLTEYLVFIEGYARTGDWNAARLLTDRVDDEPEIASLACNTWNRIEQSLPPNPDEQTLLSEVKTQLECEPLP